MFGSNSKQLAKWLALGVFATFDLTGLGCTKFSLPKFHNEESLPTNSGAATAVQVKVDGYGRPLMDGQVVSSNPEDFLRSVDKLLGEERELSSRFFVGRRIETALEVLKQIDARGAAGRSAQAVARAYDESVGLSAQAGWQAVLKDRVARPQQYAAFDTARREVLDALRSGSLTKIDSQKLIAATAHAPGSMLKLDALQLRGVVALVTDQPQPAAEAFGEAFQLAAKSDGYQASHLGLLWSDSLRRAGDHAAANRIWEQTVMGASEMVARPLPILDPTFWEKAAYLRPVSQPWPQPVVVRLIPHAPFSFGDFTTTVPSPEMTKIAAEHEVVVWGAIGQAYLDRDDAQPALVAFKRAEVAARSPEFRDWLRWSQGRALAMSGQPAAATAIWVQLSSHVDQRLAKAATASLGVMKLHQGDLGAATRLLSKAMEEQGFVDWPGRADIEADFALATLMRGEQQAGLQKLHNVQQRFSSTNNTQALAKSLWNEAKFLEHSGQKKDAQAVWTRWKQLEQASTVAAVR